jgi:hypothetical protein
MGLAQPGPQLFDCCIRSGCHLCLDRAMQISQLRRHVTALRQRLGLPVRCRRDRTIETYETLTRSSRAI